jgi:hypothetical protein
MTVFMGVLQQTGSLSKECFRSREFNRSLKIKMEQVQTRTASQYMK